MTRSARPSPVPPDDSGAPRFLLVDDDVLILRTLTRMIRSLRPEWQLFTATDAESALKLLNAAHVDVLITDLSMPGVSGQELLAMVRARHPQVVCVIHSTQTDNIPPSVRRQVQSVLQKPLSPEDLCAALEAALEVSRRQSKP
jgi:DNA-binding NtrC family response regulator